MSEVPLYVIEATPLNQQPQSLNAEHQPLLTAYLQTIFHREGNCRLVYSSDQTKWCETKLEQLLHRNVLWYRGGLVSEAHRLLYHSD